MRRKNTILLMAIALCFALMTGCSLFVPTYDFTDDTHHFIEIDGILYTSTYAPSFRDPSNGWNLEGGSQQIIGRLKNMNNNLYFNIADKQRIMLRVHASDTFMQSMMPAETQFYRQDVDLPPFCLENTDTLRYIEYNRGKIITDIESRNPEIIRTIFDLRAQQGMDAQKELLSDGYFSDDISRQVGYLRFENDEITPAGWYQICSIYAIKDNYYISTEENTWVLLDSDLLNALTDNHFPSADAYIKEGLADH